jgi:predicted nucleic acid-binding protein
VITPDSSVAVAAAAPWHTSHDAAVAALAAEPPSLIAHVALETTAALSRMPEGQRLAPSVVLAWLERRFPARWFVLPAVATKRMLRIAVDRGIRGGALYDVLIAATAAHYGLVLVSADRRAAAAYAAVAADVVYLTAD